MSTQPTEAISALESAAAKILGITPQTLRVTGEVAQERARQIALGYTAEHDDAHTLPELRRFAQSYLNRVNFVDMSVTLTRRELVKATAVLVAAIESIDRRTDA